jgi:tetraacyldisaccharide 4'-kinase
LKKLVSKPQDFGIPVISIGNLTVGGSGKTPFVIELCKGFDRPCVVMRGYGRASKGLVIVSRFGTLGCDVVKSGDEAMLIAKKAPNACVIVSEDRKKAIVQAKELGCDTVLLDDGFGKFEIQKFDILLTSHSVPKNIFCLPSGPFRFPFFFNKFADILAVEGVDFTREVACPLGDSFVLVSAIANPKRLDVFLPDNVIAKYYFPDHYYFTKKDIIDIVVKHPDSTILCTEKDAVKMDMLSVPYETIALNIKIDKSFFEYFMAKLKERFAFITLKNQAS